MKKKKRDDRINLFLSHFLKKRRKEYNFVSWLVKLMLSFFCDREESIKTDCLAFNSHQIIIIIIPIAITLTIIIIIHYHCLTHGIPTSLSATWIYLQRELWKVGRKACLLVAPGRVIHVYYSIVVLLSKTILTYLCVFFFFFLYPFLLFWPGLAWWKRMSITGICAQHVLSGKCTCKVARYNLEDVFLLFRLLLTFFLIK